MTASTHSFELGLDEWMAQSEEVARLKFIDVCLEATEELVRRSPVDTGFFRSMWSVMIDETPDFKTTVSPPKSDLDELGNPTGEVPTFTLPQATMTAQLTGLTLDTLQVWIVNPTVYGPKLENGHSKQAPEGMVGPTWAHLSAIYGGRPA